MSSSAAVYGAGLPIMRSIMAPSHPSLRTSLGGPPPDRSAMTNLNLSMNGFAGNAFMPADSHESNKSNYGVTTQFAVKHTTPDERNVYKPGFLPNTFCFVNAPGPKQREPSNLYDGDLQDMYANMSPIVRMYTLSNMNQYLKTNEGIAKYGRNLTALQLINDFVPMGSMINAPQSTTPYDNSRDLETTTLVTAGVGTVWNYWAVSEMMLRADSVLYFVFRRVRASLTSANASNPMRYVPSSTHKRKRDEMDTSRPWDGSELKNLLSHPPNGRSAPDDDDNYKPSFSNGYSSRSRSPVNTRRSRILIGPKNDEILFRNNQVPKNPSDYTFATFVHFNEGGSYVPVTSDVRTGDDEKDENNDGRFVTNHDYRGHGADDADSSIAWDVYASGYEDEDEDKDEDEDEDDQFAWEIVPYCGPPLSSAQLTVESDDGNVVVTGLAFRVGTVVSPVSSSTIIGDNKDYGRMRNIVFPVGHNTKYTQQLSKLPMLYVSFSDMSG